MPRPSAISMKLRHFFLTLTSSPCPIMLHSMAQSGLKLSGCTFQSPSNPLVSMIVATSSSQAIAKWLFRPSLHDTFVASSRSINSLPSFMLGKQKMKRIWTPLLPNVVRWSVLSINRFARLPHPEASSTITGAPLAPAPLGNTPPPSPRIPDTGRSRSPPPGRLRPIGMNPGQPLSEPSSPAVAPSSSTIPPLTVFAGPEHGPVKGKPPLQVNVGTSKGPSKSSKGVASPAAPDTPFFTIAPQKGKDAAPKGER